MSQGLDLQVAIKQCIENLQHPLQIYASWNEINESGKLVTKISTSCAPDNIEDDVWSFKEYDDDHLVMCLRRKMIHYKNSICHIIRSLMREQK